MARMAPHKVVIHSHDLSYVDSGSGPVVLFIHGILGSQRQWEHLVDKLDDDHRVVMPDRWTDSYLYPVRRACGSRQLSGDHYYSLGCSDGGRHLDQHCHKRGPSYLDQ